MEVSENVKETPRTSIALFVLVVISFIINTVGFGSASWLARREGSFGLWRCSLTRKYELCGETRAFVDWFKAVQAMVAIGFVATLVSLLLIAIFVIIAKFKSRMIARCLAMASFATVVFNLIGIAVFRGKLEDGIISLGYTKDDIRWSFYVTCAGTAMYFVSGIVAIVLITGMRT